MAASNIDYINTSFEFPTLSKIQGKPTYATVKKIKDKLKANATTVTTNLGGGGLWTLRISINTNGICKCLSSKLRQTGTFRTNCNSGGNYTA